MPTIISHRYEVGNAVFFAGYRGSAGVRLRKSAIGGSKRDQRKASATGGQAVIDAFDDEFFDNLGAECPGCGALEDEQCEPDCECDEDAWEDE